MKFTDNPGVAMDARAFSYGATVKPGAAPVLGGLAVEVNATPPVADPHVFSEPRPVLPAGEFRWGVKDGVMDPRVRVEREAPALGTGNLLAEASRKPPVIGLERQLAIDPPARWMPTFEEWHRHRYGSADFPREATLHECMNRMREYVNAMTLAYYGQAIPQFTFGVPA